MNTPKQAIWALCLFSIWALPLSASAQQQRFATIDLRQVFENYWKTKQAEGVLKEKASDLDRDRQRMIDRYTKLKADYRTTLEKANEQAVSAEEREKRKKVSETKLTEVNDLESSVTQFDRQARTTLDEQQRRIRESLLSDIRAAVELKGKSAGYTMVLDTSRETDLSTPLVLYSNNESDLTKQVLAQLNETSPTQRVKTESPKDKPR